MQQHIQQLHLDSTRNKAGSKLAKDGKVEALISQL
jgi:hypothetical protein